MRGVYVTVLVTTSRICRTLVRPVFCFFCSANLALRAASQSKTECTERALNGDLAVEALRGESRHEMAGLGGSFMLGNTAAPVGGADIGMAAVKGLGGIIGAVAGAVSRADFSLVLLTLLGLEVGGERSHLQEQSDCSVAAVPGSESGVLSPDAYPVGKGELRDMALERKSV
jgi:hypothetical protein